MALAYRNLDDRTRILMLSEIESDIATQRLFLSDNLNSQGRADYPDLLRDAARSGSDAMLATELKSRLNPHEKPRRLKSGGF